MKLHDKIKELLASDISAYRIAKDTGIPQPTITNLRNGKRKICNLSLHVAERLGKYYDSLK